MSNPLQPEVDPESCEGGNLDLCYSLGTKFLYGEGTAIDPQEAAYYFMSACQPPEFVHGDACHLLGGLMESEVGDQGSFKQAAAYYEVACTEGIFSACRKLGGFLSFGMNGVPRNSPRARALYTYACENGYRKACTHLGLMMLNGHGGPPDWKKAVPLLERECAESKDSLACSAVSGGVENVQRRCRGVFWSALPTLLPFGVGQQRLFTATCVHRTQ